MWRNQCVIVTGTTSGIGRALASEAARRGAKVGLIARRAELLAEQANELRTLGAECAFAAVDVADRIALEQVVRELEAALGPTHVLIANAGVYRKTDGRAYDSARAAQVFSTNVLGVSHSIGAVLPGMIERRAGVICGVASIGGVLSLPCAGAYCASKAAVASLLKSIRLDTHGSGVQITTVYPGFVDTAMLTEEERRTLRGVWTAERTALRILRAIELGKREDAFPWSLWLECKLASILPWPLYRLAMKTVKPMEET